MAEAKPLASLSAGLLARKGAAKPAMRRQAQLGGVTPTHHMGDDLGWNDMGYDVDPPQDGQAHFAVQHAAISALTPMASTEASASEPVGVAAAQPIHEDVQPSVEAPEPMVRTQQAEIAAAMVPPADASPVDVAPAPAPVPATVPAASPLMVRQRVETSVAAAPAPIAARAVHTGSTPPAPRVRAGTHGRFAFTLRLDPERHLRLRLASAASNRSSQQILINLIDDFLATQPEIDAFARKALSGQQGEA
ncbi:MAG: hypothetical protein IT553_00605 [Sphingomonadaceae bacterium]|nr:hypothetical protein [Sphingomonadaceae bacterium]